MEFKLERSIEILERTPFVIEELLNGISKEWAMSNEGENTFSPYDVLGHLLHGEKTDWIPRMNLILSDKTDKTFQPYDRFAQFEESNGKSLTQLLDEFKKRRQENLTVLRSKNITEKDLNKTGTHPSFGEVSLRQLLSTWTVHDLNHISQICRAMSKQYKENVGPWIDYLSILKK